jgi:hypothetical protein
VDKKKEIDALIQRVVKKVDVNACQLWFGEDRCPEKAVYSVSVSGSDLGNYCGMHAQELNDVHKEIGPECKVKISRLP